MRIIPKGAPRKASALSEVFYELSTVTLGVERERGDVGIILTLSLFCFLLDILLHSLYTKCTITNSTVSMVWRHGELYRKEK